ncbi:hypothetical protein HID58_001303 [Brassica napus]|uniref:Uncharacterized protein n=1 Tax=Brassica napus TaxID=3708 RepID=A0ABQ8EJA2_BRANA|nr:hypothetical protein HID58_001303 [Brassica napus]
MAGFDYGGYQEDEEITAGNYSEDEIHAILLVCNMNPMTLLNAFVFRTKSMSLVDAIVLFDEHIMASGYQSLEPSMNCLVNNLHKSTLANYVYTGIRGAAYVDFLDSA